MSGLETLPPDQRAVLQLILVQGRGYADLAATLRLDAAAVRERAHAGASALAGGERAGELDADTRGRVVDYLLGQQDDGERIVTFAELGESPAACRWAQDLRERLAPVAREPLPEVPASVAAVTNGSVAGGIAVASPPPRVEAPRPAAPPAPPRAPGSADDEAPTGPRPSRLGGAVLIAGALALAIVLAIVLIDGDDGDSPSAATNGAQTQTQARAQTQTSTTGAGAGAQARTIGGAVLRPVSGGSGLGAALVQQGTGARRLLAVEAARLPANGAQDFYAIWLQGPAGDRFLGFVPNQVRANGTFTVSSQLPRSVDLSAYTTVLVTSESASAVPTTPGTTILSGPLRVVG